MALDSGTTSVRAVIVDEYDCIVAQASRRIKTFYPRPGWVEQDPMEILASQIAVMMEVQFKSGIHSDRIAAIGITNQRETTVVWDRDSGLPVHNAIVWQCRRTSEITDALIADGMSDIIRDKTGLMPDPYFSGTKIKWILDNVDGARAAADAGELMFGTIDTWLIYNLTGGMVHATDYTNASRTMLFNIHTLEWDDELLELLDIPRLDAARGRAGAPDDYGSVSERDHDVRPSRSPASPATSRRRCSGTAASAPGCTKNTYGTGCFMLMNTGDDVCHVRARASFPPSASPKAARFPTRSRVRFSTPARRFSGCATSSASSPAPRRQPIYAVSLERQRRLLSGAGFQRPGRPMVGPRRARPDLRAHRRGGPGDDCPCCL
ncbi:MAG: FGGY family carbohydrate kinase [Collinsella sp.]